MTSNQNESLIVNSQGDHPIREIDTNRKDEQQVLKNENISQTSNPKRKEQKRRRRPNRGKHGRNMKAENAVKISNEEKSVDDGKSEVENVEKQIEELRIQENIDDPRGNNPDSRISSKAKKKGAGRNTESFEPESTFVRPSMRILIGSNSVKHYDRVLKHDDVVMVPELFGKEDDWTIHYKLIEEIRELQKNGEKRSEWVPWHEGAHLITKNPEGSKTYNMVIDRLCEYFNIQRKSVGTRFNW